MIYPLIGEFSLFYNAIPLSLIIVLILLVFARNWISFIGVLVFLLLYFVFINWLTTRISNREDQKLISSGKEKYDLGLYEQACREYTKALKLVKNDAYTKNIIYLMRAEAEIEIKDYESALWDISKSKELEPNNYKAYFLSAKIKFHNDQLEESLIELEKSISLASTYESHMLRGKINCELGIEQEALKDFIKAEELDPLSSEVNFEIANIAEQFYEEPKEAITYLDKAIANNKENSLYFFKRGILKNKIGNRDGAFQDLEKASKLGNKDADEYLKKF